MAACEPSNEVILRGLLVDEQLARVRAEAKLKRLPPWALRLLDHPHPDDALIEIVDRAIEREIRDWKIGAPHRVGAERLGDSIKLALRGHFNESEEDDVAA
jgi:hypothetical protein